MESTSEWRALNINNIELYVSAPKMAQTIYFPLLISLNIWIICLLFLAASQDIKDTNDGCSMGSFRCTNGACVISDFHCDGKDDCGDNSDETACSSGPCMDGYFQCKNGKCVYPSMVCNNENDCGDYSDEGTAAECPDDGSAVKRVCSNAHFQCDNGQCVPVRFKCDNKLDCEDKSDEDTGMCTGHPKGSISSSIRIKDSCNIFVAFLVIRLIVKIF